MSNDDYIVSLWCRAVSYGEGSFRLAMGEAENAKQRGSTDVDLAVFNGEVSPAIHLLTAYALELSLKVAFLLEGGNRSDLWSIGHDLEKALQAARKQGFDPQSSKIDFVIDAMRDTHLKHHFRYGDLETVVLPGIEDSFEVIRELHDQISPLVWRGQPPRLFLSEFDQMVLPDNLLGKEI